MSVCTFFGMSCANQKILPCLTAVIEELILTEHVTTFYVGDKGKFDHFVQKALCEVKERHPEIKCYTVLAYLPGKRNELELPSLLETIYPEGMENVPPRYAIDRRNRWMIERSSFVISYPSIDGNSRKFTNIARSRGKTVIDLKAEMEAIFPFRK